MVKAMGQVFTYSGRHKDRGGTYAGKPRDSVNESFAHILGDPYVSAVHGMPYKIMRDVSILIVACVYLNRLNLISSTWASVFGQQEADGFADLFVCKLKEIMDRLYSDRNFLEVGREKCRR